MEGCEVHEFDSDTKPKALIPLLRPTLIPATGSDRKYRAKAPFVAAIPASRNDDSEMVVFDLAPVSRPSCPSLADRNLTENCRMPNLQSYSIASCVVETGYRLRAHPGRHAEDKVVRAVGRALLTAEILSFKQVEDGRKKGTQGLVVSLGFYDADQLKIVQDATELLEEELAYSIGGFLKGFQLSLSILEYQTNWHGVGVNWPQHQVSKHLDLNIHNAANKGDLLDSRGESQILARRIRYRLGVDFKDESDTLFWWSTAQTESWIAELIGEGAELDEVTRKKFNKYVGAWMNALANIRISVDPLTLSADDWGLVDLEKDPITIRCVGPNWGDSPTHLDVKRILARAGKQIHCKSSPLPQPEEPEFLLSYARHLRALAETPWKPRERDVVIVYRGGGIKEKIPAKVVKGDKGIVNDESRLELVRAIEKLVAQGTEVVLGIGHGDVSVYGKLRMKTPVGVHEAITPTAAAAWVLREHVNHRILDSIVDPGQAV
jgi:hypothetical protein